MTKKITPELLALLRSIKNEADLLSCLIALQNWFPQNENIGDALLECILVVDDFVNNEPKGK